MPITITAKALREQRAEKIKELEALLATAESEDRDLTDKEQTRFLELKAETENLLKRAQRIEEVEGLSTDLTEPIDQTLPGRDNTADPATPVASAIRALPNRPMRRYGSLRAFRGPTAERDAYESGMWLRATFFGDESAREWCKEYNLNVEGRALSTIANTLGGALVPDSFERSIIDLREEYGTFRRKARVTPMASDTTIVPRRTGGVTAYYVGDNTEITASDKTWDQVELTARKLAVLTKYSSEIAEDAIISLADDLASEIAYSFSVAEDQAGFLGDATSTYGGISGLITKCTAATAGTVTCADTHLAFSDITLTELESMIGKLPEYPGIQPEWYLHKSAWAASMMRLADAAGGNVKSDIEGPNRMQFSGYPVNFVQCMNSTLTDQASAKGLIYFGDLGMAATLGDRRGLRVKVSEDRYFEYDQIGIQGTERFAINVHDVGDTSNAGPIIMLAFPAS